MTIKQRLHTSLDLLLCGLGLLVSFGDLLNFHLKAGDFRERLSVDPKNLVDVFDVEFESSAAAPDLQK